jgi:coenzyme Q-binding protein COQ10
MPRIRTNRRVRHAPERMFDLVADVESYPKFVPLCERLLLRSRTTADDGTEVVVATMTIAYKLFRESFTSRVVLDRARRVIDVTYLDGPFRKMENRWTFEPAGEGATVGFFLDYEFRNPVLALAMGAVFDKVFGRFAEAFERRADVVYPRASIASGAPVTPPRPA